MINAIDKANCNDAERAFFGLRKTIAVPRKSFLQRELERLGK